MKRLLFVFLCMLVVGILGCEKDSEGPPGEITTTYYLFRHGETVQPASQDTPDPVLDERGVERAKTLADMLADSAITHIFTSDFNRTRMTVEPLSERSGLTIESYNPYDLEQFAETLRFMDGKIVISGHSNTTPALVRLLGMDPGDPIDEKVEYNRFYSVYRSTSGGVTGNMTRFDPAMPE